MHTSFDLCHPEEFNFFHHKVTLTLNYTLSSNNFAMPFFI